MSLVLTLTVIPLFALIGAPEDPVNIHPKYIGLADSVFSLETQNEYQKSVWAIVASKNGGEVKSGRNTEPFFWGTAFLIQESSTEHRFVTAAHVFEGAALGRFSDTGLTKLYLVHPDIATFRLDLRNVYLCKDQEVALITIPRISSSEIKPLPVGELRKGMILYNLGFPGRAAVKIEMRHQEGHETAFSFSSFICQQRGEFLNALRLSLSSADISHGFMKSIILDYTSEPGFSGGPLISTETNKVVGMMIGCLRADNFLETSQPRTVAYALYIEEVLNALESCAKDLHKN